MIHKPIFTFIITYKHTNDRLDNLKKVISWLLGFNNIEIIIVEQDNSPKLRFIDLPGCNYHFLKNDKTPFNKSWAFNYGLKYSKSDIIIFGDADLIIDPNLIIKSINELRGDDKLDMISPYDRNKVIDLKPSEINLDVENIIKIKRKSRIGVPLCGGINIIKRDSIKKIGGWSEDFIGWGGEDNFQSYKVEKYLKYKEYTDESCYHLYHNKGEIFEHFYKRNLNLLNELTKVDDVILNKYINDCNLTNGIKHKYEN